MGKRTKKPEVVRFAVFPTNAGTHGIAWSPSGIKRVFFPFPSGKGLKADIRKRHPDWKEGRPTGWAKTATVEIARYHSGRAAEMGRIPLDYSGLSDFCRAVYETLRQVRPGTTTTYKELAEAAGFAGAARAVGRAMAANPFPIIVPCHRVLGAGGRISGFSAPGGPQAKIRLLKLEGFEPQAPQPKRVLVAKKRNSPSLDSIIRQGQEHLSSVDPVMARLIREVGACGLRTAENQGLFQSLVEAIVYQQLTARAAETILGRVKGLFPGSPEIRPFDIVRAEDDELRGAGLSRPKILALRDLAEKTLAGLLPDVSHLASMSDEDIVERLTEVRGIGRWTVEMLLIFRLARPDVLPATDYGVQKGFAAAYRKDKLPSPKELAAFGERWKPFRTIASWYLWRAAEKGPG